MHTQSLGLASSISSSIQHVMSACLNASSAERSQPYPQTSFPGSRPSLVPEVPRRKTLQPDKAGWPYGMSPRALLPSPGPTVHPLPHGEKHPSQVFTLHGEDQKCLSAAKECWNWDSFTGHGPHASGWDG